MPGEGSGEGSTWSVFRGDALDAYAQWPTPAVVISDGAYGVGGFLGDPRTADGLADWYEPHIESWSKHARASSTLWFWNTELGWATVHPVLARHGWEYVQSIVWDKGIAHIAGNVNGSTIRRFPVVTEVCAFYRRRLEFPTPDGVMSAKRWLRYEWQRAGLPLSKANEACGVANAQVPHTGLAVVFPTTEDDGAAGALRQRARTTRFCAQRLVRFGAGVPATQHPTELHIS